MNALVDELLRAFLSTQVPSFPQLDAQTPTIRSDRSKEDLNNILNQDQIDLGVQCPQDVENERAEELLRFYTKVTGNMPTPDDREEVRSVFDFPDVLIHTGILRSLAYSAEPLVSFKYCVKTIRQIAESTVDPVEAFERTYAKLFSKVNYGQLTLPAETRNFLIGKFGKPRAT